MLGMIIIQKLTEREKYLTDSRPGKAKLPVREGGKADRGRKSYGTGWGGGRNLLAPWIEHGTFSDRLNTF